MSAFYGDLNIGSVGHGAATIWYPSLLNKKPPWLSAAFCVFDGLFLVLVEDAKIGAPAEQFFGCHGGPDFGKRLAQLLGNAKLEHEPVVSTEFGA